MFRRRRRRRLGLRARVTVIYALGALLMSALVAVSTFTLTQSRLLDQAETAAREQAYENAMELRRRLQSVPNELLDPPETPPSDTPPPGDSPAPGISPATTTPTPATLTTTTPTTAAPTTTAPTTTAATIPGSSTSQASTTVRSPVDINDVLRALGVSTTTSTPNSPSTSTTLPAPEAGPIEQADAITPILGALRYSGRVDSLLYFERDRSLSGLRKSELPNGLRFLVENNQGASQRFSQNNTPMYAVGVPIIAVGSTGATAQYYEVTSFVDLQSTLNLLQVILGGTALAASLAGASLGWYSARRALQPLVDVSAAAQSIALGQFDTRLDEQIDPDLVGLTNSFNDMVDALRTRIERDAQFASNVSHELRSPLMTLAAAVGVLEGRRSDLPAPAQRAVELLGQEVRRFEQLVTDLLEISRLDVGAVELERDAIMLSEFLRFVVARSQTPDIPVVYDPPDRNLVVLVDKRRLAQSISNLLDNALKYAGQASEVGFRRTSDPSKNTSTVASDSGTKDWVEIYVEDRGPGVPVADRERIFDRFTRAAGDAGRRELTTGVGLGLSLVAEHIRLHGGRVWVTDRIDGSRGARFIVAIPVGADLEFDEERAL